MKMKTLPKEASAMGYVNQCLEHIEKSQDKKKEAVRTLFYTMMTSHKREYDAKLSFKFLGDSILTNIIPIVYGVTLDDLTAFQNEILEKLEDKLKKDKVEKEIKG